MKTSKTKLISLFLVILMLFPVCSVMFAVNAYGDRSVNGTIRLDCYYEEEYIEIVWDTGDNARNKAPALEEIGGTVIYMYALKANDSNQAAEKWYPVMGYDIEISKIIPKKGTVKIAVREAGDVLKNGKYATRKTIEIKARPEVKDLKTAVSYNVAKERFETTSTKEVEIILSDSEDSNFILKGDAYSWDIPMDAFPTGATYSYRLAAIDGDKASNSNFSSLWSKGKIAAQPKAPKLALVELKANPKKNTAGGWTVKGATEKISVYLGKVTDTKGVTSDYWVPLTGLSSPSVSELKSFISAEIAKVVKKYGETNVDAESVKALKDDGIEVDLDPENPVSRNSVEEYILTFRTPATDKKPASAKASLSLKKEQYEIIPTATFTGSDVINEKATAPVTSKAITITLKNGKFISDIADKNTEEKLITIDGVPVKTCVYSVAKGTVDVTVEFAKDAGEIALTEIEIKAGAILDDDGFATTEAIIATGKIRVLITEKET